ncbi:hypothetical protein QQ045_006348 [Rhodiola kirilowii]
MENCDLVFKLCLFKKLQKLTNADINMVSFNEIGDVVISSSSDNTVTLWNWEAGGAKLTLGSGHSDLICQAKFIQDREVDLRTLIATKLFKCYPNSITCRHVELYDIAMDPSRLSYHLAAAGSDNYARVYDIRGCNRDEPA